MDILTEQLTKIKRGVSEIISEKELIGKLEFSIKNKIPLKVKAGFDPTAPDIHLGHTVLLRKLRHFQNIGHKVIFLIGDATALVGDPSGQSKTRKTMTWEEVEINAKTYCQQVANILDIKNINLFEMIFNSQWFSRHGAEQKNFPPFTFEQFVELAQRYTVARLLERDDFQKRLKENKPISFLELFYPLMQGYDSVKIGECFGSCDVEIGGTDQKFNMLVGRDLQAAYGQKPQIVITMPLLEGTDGVNKMSKSLGNYIGTNEPPEEIFGKIMSISDSLMYKYYELLTDEDLSEVKNMHPREAKVKLGALLITQYYNKSEAQKVRESFERVFKNKKVPLEVLEYKIEKQTKIMDILTAGKMVKSRNEARRLIQQGGVIFDNEKIKDEDFLIAKSGILKSGARRFLKVILGYTLRPA